MHHQDEALAIQTLRRQFAQLGQSKKASRRVTGRECLHVLLLIMQILRATLSDPNIPDDDLPPVSTSMGDWEGLHYTCHTL